MKIAQIAPVIECVPPKKYGGTERIVYALTEELVRRGHEVTLFASGNSKTSAKLFPLLPVSAREMDVSDLYGENYARLVGVGKPYEYQDEFDIIHDHNEPLSVPTANIASIPVVMTLHSAFEPNIHLYQRMTKPYLISISKSQVPPLSGINHVDTIYHGFNMDNYPFSASNDGYLLFVGRIDQEKGVHHAIAAAKMVKRQLIIAAKLDNKDMDYFKNYIEPMLSEQAVWIGEVDEKERNKLMANALCLLHPACWQEPFGLSIIEAMACGCPVIGFGRGSIPELIQNERTGYVVNNVTEMVEAIKKIEKIDREDCRRYALENFNVERMVDEYEMVYEAILKGKYRKNGKRNYIHSLYTPATMLHTKIKDHDLY